MTGFRNAMMGAAGAAGGGFAVDNSIVFNDDDSQYLIRENASNSTTGGADARKKFTVSLWWKHGNINSGGQNLFIQRNSSSNYLKCGIAGTGGNNGALQFFAGTLGAFNTGDTTAVLRDHHAWYHILFYYDSTDGTAGDRARIYLNGVRLTDFQTSATNPSSGAITQFGSNNAMVINQQQGGSQYGDGYMAEMVVIDGQALTPSSFTEFDDNGVLRPLDISKQGFTFGDQGFYLPFTNSAGLGQDYSGSTSTTVVQKNTYNAGSEINEGDSSASPSTGMLFIPPATGTVSKIELNASSRGFSGVTVRLETDSGSGQAPSGTIVPNGEVTGITSSGAGMKTATFSTPPEVTAGVKYWIVLRGDTGTWGWQHDVSGSGGALGLYQGGLGYFSGRGVGHNVYMTGNHFGAENSPTQTTDTPTKNFATMTPLFKPSSQTFSEGNLKVTATGSNQNRTFSSTAIPNTGKWYFEVTNVVSGENEAGIIGLSGLVNNNLNVGPQNDATGYIYHMGSSKTAQHNSVEISPALDSSVFSNGDVLGVAVDMDANSLWFARNNSWYNSGNPATGANALYTNLTDTGYMATARPYGAGTSVKFNFGATTLAYTPPTGFNTWNTTTFFEASPPTIEDGSAYFQTTIYPGNGSTQTIIQSENSTFQPDMIWGKQRTGAQEPTIFDAVRGATKYIQTNSTAAEATQSGVTAFNSNGFNLGSWAVMNESSNNHVAWQWKGGDSNTTVSESGTGDDAIAACTHRANQTAGFSIVTYQGKNDEIGNSDHTKVAHGLGKKPDLIIGKNLASGKDWFVMSIPQQNDAHMHLNHTTQNIGSDFTGTWSDSDTTHFVVGNDDLVNEAGANFVAYVFAEIPGFSKFGAYEGNVDPDGVFIHLGFRPSFFMAKNMDTTGAWLMFDSAREPFNLVDLPLEADDNKQEAASGGRELDFLSNGVKLRGNSSYLNSAHTFLYMAFAEHPFAGTTPATAR